MKNFFSILVMWIIILLVATFFAGAFFIGIRNIYRVMVLIALVFSVITYALVEQSDKIETLQKKVAELEDKIGH